MCNCAYKYKNAKKCQGHYKSIEISVISSAYAIADPWTMMIESLCKNINYFYNRVVHLSPMKLSAINAKISFDNEKKRNIYVHYRTNNLFEMKLLYVPTQLSHRLQWEALGGLNILHVKQYFSFTGCPLIKTSFVLGGGLYVLELPLFGTSARSDMKNISIWHLRFIWEMVFCLNLAC